MDKSAEGGLKKYRKHNGSAKQSSGKQGTVAEIPS